MKLAERTIEAMLNGYWRADLHLSDGDVVHRWQQFSFHDRAEAEAWMDHMEHVMTGRVTTDLAAK